jgi:glycosidase
VFLGNHDVGRYATEIAGCPNYQLFGGCPDLMAEGGDNEPTGALWVIIIKLATSFAFVATQPGPPLLYYGDVIGLAGAGDPDNRRLMDWDRSRAQDILLERYQQLGQLRASNTALQQGERVELWVDDSLYVYARGTDSGDVAIVALYIGDAPRTQTMDLYGNALVADGTLTNALPSDRTASVANSQLTLTLNPWEYAVFVPGE